ncbi:hypothetical protein QR98_0079900 [Sarcoptes scabiei]|uniref:Uncharacterized protein n=1 Tax=Sarcoptes scabiei TaxID=52283 RepID=A0A132AEP4_SARSC|nr:hypothetical protein QR98_0079900 [Sarcoptes scabiei]
MAPTRENIDIHIEKFAYLWLKVSNQNRRLFLYEMSKPLRKDSKSLDNNNNNSNENENVNVGDEKKNARNKN